MIAQLVLTALAALLLGIGAGLFARKYLSSKHKNKTQEEAKDLLAKAEEQKRQTLLEAREDAIKIRSSLDEDVRMARQELQSQERRAAQREQTLERLQDSLTNKEQTLLSDKEEVDQRKVELEDLKAAQIQKIEELAGLNTTQAKDLVFKKAEGEMTHELAQRYYQLEHQYNEEADKKARKVISLAIQRLASDVVSESSTAVVPLPSDEMKGRLIGREGRNIRALESAMGVDIIVDDTPEVVTVSCFDPIRREIARLALQKLIMDGRIHPARIEEVVSKAEIEIEEAIAKEGEQAVFDAGVRGLNPDLIKLLGRLKYRYSYGENVLRHAVEVSLLAGMLATEINADVEVAKMGGLLHDIGKALTHEIEGPHAEIGGDMARKYGIPDAVRKAIEEHHDPNAGSVEAFLVVAADAISAARPGARMETMEFYVKRMEALEEVARSFPGIEKAYAIQAGREVRVMVKPDHIDDIAATNLARQVVKQIEQDLVYPGQIKVTVIRETRAVDIAR